MLDSNLKIALQASLKAGKAIMEIYDAPNLQVEYKDDYSPLTLADKKSNEIINSYLKPTLIPVISEENKRIDFRIRKNWETCWIVDPVDGTKEYIKRNGEFTVNIALVTKASPQLGIIYAPAIKTLYFSDVSQKKSFKAVLDSHETEIDEIMSKAKVLKPHQSSLKQVKVVGSRSHMNNDTLHFVNNLKLAYKHVEIVSKGSSLKFCLVAEGLADVYPRFAPTMEWDTAAGQAICNAVGVKVIDQSTNEPLLYNKENLLNNYFLVTK